MCARACLCVCKCVGLNAGKLTGGTSGSVVLGPWKEGPKIGSSVACIVWGTFQMTGLGPDKAVSSPVCVCASVNVGSVRLCVATLFLFISRSGEKALICFRWNGHTMGVDKVEEKELALNSTVPPVEMSITPSVHLWAFLINIRPEIKAVKKEMDTIQQNSMCPFCRWAAKYEDN